MSEAYQTILRREGVEKPYELLKKITRGKAALNKEEFTKFCAVTGSLNSGKGGDACYLTQNYLGYIDLPE